MYKKLISLLLTVIILFMAIPFTVYGAIDQPVAVQPSKLDPVDYIINAVPGITGPSEITLDMGYSTTSSEKYTLRGNPTVTKVSGDAKITWNSSTNKLDIAAGLEIGTYEVELKAENALTFVTFIVKVKVMFPLIDPQFPSIITDPDIIGEAAITLAAGYAATSSAAYTINGFPTPAVTLTSANSKITWDNTAKKINIAAGLTVGVYQVVLQADSSIGNDTHIVTITVTEANTTPVITGSSAMTLNAGYAAASSEALTISGFPVPTVTKVSGDSKITWNNTTKKLDIAAGLTVGVYQVILQASNSVGNVLHNFTLTVADTNTVPVITGSSAMTLNTGYAATSTDVYTISGTPAPTVTKVSGDSKITWNNNTKKLDIAAGLTAGVYNVILKASNIAGDTIFMFTLTIGEIPAQPIMAGTSEMTLGVGYKARSTDAFSISGTPAPTITKMSGDSKITWNNSTKKLDIAAGLTSGIYQVVLKASNSAGEILFIFALTVSDLSPSAPTITGEAAVTLDYGYSAKSTEVYTIDGFPVPTAAKASGDPKITWNDSTKKFDIAAGLESGVYQVVLKAVNSAGEKTFIVVITVKADESDKSSMDNFKKVKSYTRGQFKDIDETLWYGFDQLKVIAGAYEYDLMKGTGDTTFEPNGNITIAEAITMAVRVHSIYTTGTAAAPKTEPWFRGFVEYAVMNELISAASFTNFDRAATRAEMVFIFSRALPMKEFTPVNTVNSLPDVNKDTSYSESIFTFYRAGVVVGNDDKGTFAPEKNITRAEAAAIISRVILPATRIGGKSF